MGGFVLLSTLKLYAFGSMQGACGENCEIGLPVRTARQFVTPGMPVYNQVRHRGNLVPQQRSHRDIRPQIPQPT